MGEYGREEPALAAVRRNGRRIIDAELARLLRRSPQLARQDVAVIDQALDRVLDRLIVDPVRRIAGARPDLLESVVGLFDPPGHLRVSGARGPMVCSGEPRRSPGAGLLEPPPQATPREATPRDAAARETRE